MNRPNPAEIQKMRDAVKRLQRRRDAILKSRDFSTLADCLDELDTAEATLFSQVPEDAPVQDRLTGIFGTWGQGSKK